MRLLFDCPKRTWRRLRLRIRSAGERQPERSLTVCSLTTRATKTEHRGQENSRDALPTTTDGSKLLLCLFICTGADDERTREDRLTRRFDYILCVQVHRSARGACKTVGESHSNRTRRGAQDEDNVYNIMETRTRAHISTHRFALVGGDVFHDARGVVNCGKETLIIHLP